MGSKQINKKHKQKRKKEKKERSFGIGLAVPAENREAEVNERDRTEETLRDAMINTHEKNSCYSAPLISSSLGGSGTGSKLKSMYASKYNKCKYQLVTFHKDRR